MSRVNFAQPDVTLTLDLDGIIRRAVFSGALSSVGTIDWVGRSFAETVVGSADAQVRRMLEDARTSGVSPFQEVCQRLPGGAELAFEYTTVRLGGDAGLLAIGRSLEAVAEVGARLNAARLSMERDSWKLRGVETRYRQLFDASEQPVVLLDASSLAVVEANAAATRALGVESGNGLVSEIRETERSGFQAMLARVREEGKAPAVVIHVRADRTPWLVRASLVAAAVGAVFVLQLSPSGSAPYLVSPNGPTLAAAPRAPRAPRAPHQGRSSEFRLDDLIARLPEPFVVVDREGNVVRANPAFLDLVEISEERVLGRPLDAWVVSPAASPSPSSSASIGALLLQLQRVTSVREHPATIRGDLGKMSHVAIAAAGNVDAEPNFVGLLMRRLDKSDQKAVIRAAVSSIERQCLDAVERLTKRSGRDKPRV